MAENNFQNNIITHIDLTPEEVAALKNGDEIPKPQRLSDILHRPENLSVRPGVVELTAQKTLSSVGPVLSAAEIGEMNTPSDTQELPAVNTAIGMMAAQPAVTEPTDLGPLVTSEQVDVLNAAAKGGAEVKAPSRDIDGSIPPLDQKVLRGDEAMQHLEKTNPDKGMGIGDEIDQRIVSVSTGLFDETKKDDIYKAVENAFDVLVKPEPKVDANGSGTQNAQSFKQMVDGDDDQMSAPMD